MVDGQNQQFEPVRRKGNIFHAAVMVILISIGSGILWLALNKAQGSLFVLLMILLLVIIIALPVIGYRAYALLNARYIVERDGLRLRWGLRIEDIPLSAIEWVRPANESGFHVSPPLFIWPGAVLGTRIHPDLGDVEFIASDSKNLVLIATRKKTYAISPNKLYEFVSTFQRLLELGSLSPITPRSAKPTVFFQQVLKDPIARLMLPANLILTFLLWVVSGFIIANHQLLPIGFSPTGIPETFVPSEQLLLLPVIGVFVLVADLFSGMFFFRKDEARNVAYLMWLGGILTPLLLMTAVILLSTFQ